MTIPVLKFGKPSGPLLQQKANFFQENDKLQANIRRLCDIYSQQPRRELCKNCAAHLGPATFEKLGVTYIVCDRCGHLNGAHEDSDFFCESMYTAGGGSLCGNLLIR